MGKTKINQFQLTQPIISGRRFFEYSLHYEKLLEELQLKLQLNNDDKLVPNKRTGDLYIKQLFECVLLFFIDKFNIESLSDEIILFLYKWCYSLRLVMHLVYPETINKYALGKHERLNSDINIFEKISEMKAPEEINLIILQDITLENIPEKNRNNYSKIIEKLGIK